MKNLRNTFAAAIVGIFAFGAAAAPAYAQSRGPVTYVALVWVKKGGTAALTEYENRFRSILGKWKANAKPVAVVAPLSINTQDPAPFGYRLPDRIDVVTFPDGGTWPRIQVSKEWLAIKPIRDAALENLVIFEAQNLMDKAH